MPNHILFRTGVQPLSRLMRRLLTGYVIGFNSRHRRSGQLFQNRYKSIICQEETYLRELVRYIHLNPLRAGIVQSLAELKSYQYCDHSCLMGKVKRSWQDADYVLGYFGRSRAEAVRKPDEVFLKGRQDKRVKARSLLCFWAARELGLSHTELAKKLEMSLAGIGFSVERGESIVKKENYSLE